MDMTLLILIGIVIVCAYGAYVGFVNPSGKKRQKALQNFVSPDEKIVYEQHAGVSYLGGHPPFGAPFTDGSMIVTDRSIIFLKDVEKGIFTIPYEDMVSVSTETKESLTATRVILVGIFAPLWKKKEPFVLIQMKNEIGETSPVAFGFTLVGMGHPSYPAWTTQRWFQVISEQRYNWFKNKKASSCRGIGGQIFILDNRKFP
jgi:hypothetical protein